MQTLAMKKEDPRVTRLTEHESGQGRRALPQKQPGEVADLMEALRRAAEHAKDAARDQPHKGNRKAATDDRRRPAE